MDRLTLNASVLGQFNYWYAEIEIPPIYRYEFERRDFTDDKFMGEVLGSVFIEASWSEYAATIESLKKRLIAHKNMTTKEGLYWFLHEGDSIPDITYFSGQETPSVRLFNSGEVERCLSDLRGEWLDQLIYPEVP